MTILRSLILAALAFPAAALVYCPISTIHYSARLAVHGGVAPPRINAASPSSSRLALNRDPSPTNARYLWDSTLAQATPPQSPPAAQTPAARPEDVRSVDAIIGALYASISGKLGEKRDWNRMRSLFVPGARLIPLAPVGNGGVPRILTVEEYITRNGPLIEQRGFSEKEIFRVQEQFGNMVHVWSTYAGTNEDKSAPPPARGINSIQLSNDGTRWWIANIFWESETPSRPLPANYLPRGGTGN